MLPQVKLLDEMDDQMWSLLQRNLTGITEAEADWRPHPAANNVRWLVGHLAWFEEWAHDALRQEGRYNVDRDPTAYLDGTIPELIARFAVAHVIERASRSSTTPRWIDSSATSGGTTYPGSTC
jgi:hypothetical protein